ncbi:phytanoyl-CoA dioxygenase family protein [Chloroflexi bacterium TSY]|nr:phytanoyl-CoA dioxygenase family protein [Chloroflexi bacterium TSY]
MVLPGLFSPQECQTFVEHVEDLRDGRKTLTGFEQNTKYGFRSFNQHLYDPKALDLLIDARLRQPLANCLEGEAEGIQTMHFFEGSEVPWHQDQYYLPDCVSAWLAMVDVDEGNGPLGIIPGSHKGRLITKKEIPEPQSGSDETFDQWMANRYFPAVQKLVQEDGRDSIQVLVKQGDVIFFHGRRLHSGMPVKEPGRARHAFACHYIPYQSENWDRDWPRISFDGTQRIHYSI